MGTACWRGISEEKFIQAEEKMLSYTNIERDQLKVYNLGIDKNNNYIRTIELGEQNEQILVLVHGYGGSGIMFYKTLKGLLEGGYHIYLVDIIGMGGSSRPNFLDIVEDSLEKAEEFLVSWLEQWRVSVGDIKDFYLAGHSFGGYVCGLYTLKYQQYVKKLILLSPFGFAKMPENFNLEEEVQKFPKDKRPPKCAFKLAQKVFDKRWSPFGFMRKCGGLFTTFFLNKFAQKRIKTLPENEFNDYKDYLKQTLLRDGSTEYAVFICFQFNFFAKKPLSGEDRLQQINIPISLFFGDIDWMPKNGYKEVLDQNQHKDISKLVIIKNSDHHMYFDNPTDFTEKLLQDLQLTNRYFQQNQSGKESKIQEISI